MFCCGSSDNKKKDKKKDKDKPKKKENGNFQHNNIQKAHHY